MAELTDTQRDVIAAKIKDAFYEARDQGRTMHQAAEDQRIFDADTAVVREHVTAALDEIEKRIEERLGVTSRALRIVRDYRQEQDR